MHIFTVIIATCGRPGVLVENLAAVAEAIRVHNAGDCIIVVDNDRWGSAEGVVERFRADSGLTVTYLRSSKPRNKCAALNTGIAAAETDWVAFTDDDTVPDRDWLVQADEYIAQSSCRYFGGRIIAGEPDGPLPRWALPDRTGSMPRTEGIFVQYDPLQTTGVLSGGASVPFGANAFARKDLFKELGGYDASLWDICGKAALGVDDGEFGVRLQNAGEVIGYCREAVVVHPVHHDRCSFRRQMRLNFYYGWRDPLVFFELNRPLVELYRSRLFLSQMVKAMFCMVRGRRADAVTAFLQSMRSAGCLTCRFSRSYRKRIAYEEERTDHGSHRWHGLGEGKGDSATSG